MADGAAGFKGDFTGPPLLRILLVLNLLRLRVSHTLRMAFPRHSALNLILNAVLQPQLCRNITGLGCSAFARHYLRNHSCFLLLWVLRCFSSPRSLLASFDADSRSSTGRVAPFGNLRINRGVLFPVAYRSLSRPSSPLRP